MDQKIVERAGEIINSRTGFIGNGMEGYVTLALIDEDGYPTASTATISKADGIKWLTFLSELDTNKPRRIAKCNKGSVCLSSSEYNITLVGTLEILTDLKTKKEMWQEPMREYYSGPEEPKYCVLRFNTECYNLYFAADDKEAKGIL